MWLGDLAQLSSQGGLPNGGRAQFAGCLVQHFGADYGPGGIGLLVQPLLGEAIQLVLRPHSVLVLRSGDTLNLIAERYGTTESKLRSLNPVLQQSEAYVTTEGETLSSVAESQNLTLSLMRQFNPELSSWPSEEPLPAGTTLLLPLYRSTTLIPAGMQLLVPGYLPSTPLPAGEWIYPPAGGHGPVGWWCPWPLLCQGGGRSVHPMSRVLQLPQLRPVGQRRTGTTCMPIGARAISASLMCWMPKGMPMIVMKQATAELRWPIASHQPASRNQITLPTRPKGPVPKSLRPVSSRLLTASLPKGQNE
jgi:LysM repeat protein